MARIDVSIEDVDDVEDEDTGETRSGVRATCGDCGFQTESFGQGDGSRRRCLALMRRDCPEGQANYYVDEDA